LHPHTFITNADLIAICKPACSSQGISAISILLAQCIHEPNGDKQRQHREAQYVTLASWLGPVRRFILAHLKALMVKGIEFGSAGA